MLTPGGSFEERSFLSKLSQDDGGTNTSGGGSSFLEITARQRFLVEFFLEPSIEKVSADYRWIQSDYPRDISNQKFDTWKLEGNHFSPTLNLYLSRPGSVICNDFREAAVTAAKTYANLNLGHCEYLNRADGAVAFTRIWTLLLHPKVISDKVSLDIMLALKDLQNSEPWCFEMWHNFSEHKSSHLRPGFGVEQIAGFARLATNDELWKGTSNELRRVFFSSVGMALRYLAREDLVSTVDARIQIIRRNNSGSNYHEPTCESAFRADEVRTLKELTLSHPNSSVRETISEQLGQIAEHGCVAQMHSC